MGNVKSLYSKNEYLYWYIQKGNLNKVKQHLQKYPQIVNQPMTRDCKSLPLARAVWRGDVKMVELLLSMNAHVNQANSFGQTAALVAAKRNRLEILKILIANEADVNYVCQQLDLQIIQYAILGGFYEVAHYLYPMIKQKKFKTAKQYRDLAIRYHYRYVNYDLFISSVQARVQPSNLQDIYHKHKPILKDPVIDPRQSWKQWFKRVMDFKPAPLVERDQLPEELQPQNRSLGKFHHYMDSIISRSTTNKPQIYPKKAQSEIYFKEINENSENDMIKNKVVAEL